MIKKILIIIFSFLAFVGCEGIPDGTIEPETVDYTIVDISAPDFVVFSPQSNNINTSITIQNSESVVEVWFDITTLEGLEKVSISNIMTSSGSGSNRIYSGQAAIDESLLSGSYEIVYFVKDNIRTSDENVRKVGTKIFEYQSEAENFPPEIGQLVLPAEVSRNVNFVFSIKVTDPNGLTDISKVYFKLKRPDGSIVYSDSENRIEEFPMFDNGDNANAGDQVAGDGIYSLKNSFGTTSQTGDWTFEFGAVDKSGSESNTIIQSIEVK